MPLEGEDNDFPSFSEGLSLRAEAFSSGISFVEFPFLFGGTFIEGLGVALDVVNHAGISLPFRRDFH